MRAHRSWRDVPCDPLFREGFERVREGREAVLEWARGVNEEFQNRERPTRDRKQRVLHNV